MYLKLTDCTITDKSGFAPDCDLEALYNLDSGRLFLFSIPPIWFRFNTRDALYFLKGGGLALQLKLELEGLTLASHSDDGAV